MRKLQKRSVELASIGWHGDRTVQVWTGCLLGKDIVTKSWNWRSAEEIVLALEQTSSLIEAGATVSAAIATVGIASATYFRWRKQFVGLSPARVKEIAELKQEVSRLRRAIAEIESK